MIIIFWNKKLSMFDFFIFYLCGSISKIFKIIKCPFINSTKSISIFIINPNIFKTSDVGFSPELLKAVDYKIEQQNEYTYRRRDNDGSSDWDNWVPGKAPPGVAAGGKRRKKSRKTRKARKSRKI